MQHAPINDPARNRFHQFGMWNAAEGSGDRLPIAEISLLR
jgi:hypothetical protein